MPGTFSSLFDSFAASRTARRRARNLRAGSRGPAHGVAFAPGIDLLAVPANGWLWGALLLVGGGALALALHARALPAAGGDAPGASELALLQPLAPGLHLVVPREPGVTLSQEAGVALVIASGMQAGAPVRVDLCTQMLDPGQPRLLPLLVGYPFEEAAALARTRTAPPRSVLLANAGSSMPRVQISGNAGSGQNLTLSWNAGAGTAGWVGDAASGRVTRARQGRAALGRSGWLVWNGQALRLVRQASAGCPQAGELVLTHYRAPATDAGAALVQAFPAAGAAVSLRLAPGGYQVPLKPGVGMEDQALFEALRARGLLRLGADGLIEVAPRDLLAWHAA